jgi:hypothetical protein
MKNIPTFLFDPVCNLGGASKSSKRVLFINRELPMFHIRVQFADQFPPSGNNHDLMSFSNQFIGQHYYMALNPTLDHLR